MITYFRDKIRDSYIFTYCLFLGQVLIYVLKFLYYQSSLPLTINFVLFIIILSRVHLLHSYRFIRTTISFLKDWIRFWSYYSSFGRYFSRSPFIGYVFFFSYIFDNPCSTLCYSFLYSPSSTSAFRGISYIIHIEMSCTVF